VRAASAKAPDLRAAPRRGSASGARSTRSITPQPASAPRAGIPSASSLRLAPAAPMSCACTRAAASRRGRTTSRLVQRALLARVPAHQGAHQRHARRGDPARARTARAAARPPHPLSTRAARSSYAPTPSWSSSCGNSAGRSSSGSAASASAKRCASWSLATPCSSRRSSPGRHHVQGALRLTRAGRGRAGRRMAGPGGCRCEPARARAAAGVRLSGMAENQDERFYEDERYFRPQGKAG